MAFSTMNALLTAPFYTAFWGVVGYVYGTLANVSPRLCVKILIISEIADRIFLVAISLQPREMADKMRRYAYANLICNSLTIIAMRQLNLISTKSTLLLGGFSLLIFFTKIGKSLIPVF